MLGNGTASDWVTLFTRFGCYQSIQWALLAEISPIDMGHLHLLDCSEGCYHPSRWRITNRSVGRLQNPLWLESGGYSSVTGKTI